MLYLDFIWWWSHKCEEKDEGDELKLEEKFLKSLCLLMMMFTEKDEDHGGGEINNLHNKIKLDS